MSSLMMMVERCFNISSFIVPHILVARRMTSKINLLPQCYTWIRPCLLHKQRLSPPENILLSNKAFSSNLLFYQFLTHIISFQGFPPFLGTNYSSFLILQLIRGYSSSSTDKTLDLLYDNTDTSKAPSTLSM